MDSKFEGLRRGLFKHNKNPGLIRQVKLKNYLKFCTNRTRLIKEIAFCLITPVNERIVKPHYVIAFNSCSLPSWDFQVVYNKVKHYKSLESLLIIDISIINKPDTRDTLFDEYPWLKKDLLIELNLINKHGK